MLNRVGKIILIVSIPIILGAGCSLGFSGNNDAGVWYSGNKAETWQQKVFVSQEKKKAVTIAGLDVNLLEFHPLDSRILYAGTNKGVYFTENSADNWQLIYNSPILDLDPAYNSRGTIYLAAGNRILKTIDNGIQWQQKYIDSRPNVFITQVAIDPLDNTRVYAGSSSGDLLISNDEGNSWQSIRNFENHITKIIVSPRDNHEMYVATARKGIYASFDRGVTWQSSELYLKEIHNALEYRDLVYDETREGALLYASAFGLHWTEDGGSSWQEVQMLTPPRTVNIRSLVLNPNNPKEIYYADAKVLYRTFDGGENWLTSSLPSKRSASALIVDFFNENNIYLGVRRIKE